MSDERKETSIESAETKEEDRLKINRELAFLKLLYDEPLYNFIGEDENDMNVLVLGWDDSSEVFADLCLEVAQMDKHPLNIEIAVKGAEDAKEAYLAQREAISTFVNVNGSMEYPDNPDTKAFASLNFIEFDGEDILCSSDEDNNIRYDQLLDLLDENKRENAHYFLISYGDDNLNKQIAEWVADSVSRRSDLSGLYSVHYVADEIIGNVQAENAAPICINRYGEEPAIDEELDRMAFNAHLVWNLSDLDQDYEAVFEEFKRDLYDYSSSIAFAVSVKYKLNDLGVDLSDPYSAADTVYEILNSDAGFIDRLAALEHRRWILEKAVDGWKAPSDDELKEPKMVKYCEGCFKRLNIKDGEKKIHPAMVRSEADKKPLEESIEDYLRDHNQAGEAGTPFEYWDGNLEPKEIDELDLVSLRLHRGMRKKANEYVSSKPFENESCALKKLRDMMENIIANAKEQAGDTNLEDVESLEQQWERFRFCIENMLEKNISYTRQYDTVYKRDFLNEIARNDILTSDEIKKISDYVNFIEVVDDSGERSLIGLEAELFPLIEANLYRNYKDTDKLLIQNLPFILTYRRGISLAAPFRLLDPSYALSETAFSNVASATVIRPSDILYLVYIDNSDKILSTCSLMKNCTRYLKDKNISQKITFFVVYDSSVMLSGEDKRAIKDVEKASAVMEATCTGEEDAAHKFINILEERKPSLFDGTKSVFSSTLVNSEFYDMLRDKLSFNETESNPTKYFEFDYKNKTFSKNEACRFISYIIEESHIRVEDMFNLAGAENFELTYRPFGSIYKKLWNIYVGKDSGCDSLLQAIEDWNALCNAISDYHYPEDVEDAEHNSDMEIPESEISKRILEKYSAAKWKRIKNILNKLSKIGVVGRWGDSVKSETHKAFRYASESAKDMLTKAGAVLEICLYFGTCARGSFDEEASGYSFVWDDGRRAIRSEEGYVISNELDLVLTKGFRSFVVECKARRKLSQDFYYKLDSLANTFGVGVTKILVTAAELPDDNRYLNTYQRRNCQENEMQRNRGESMGIKTLFLNEVAKKNSTDLPRIEDVAAELEKIALGED